MSTIYNDWRRRRPRPAPATFDELVAEWEKLAEMWEAECDHARASVYRDTANDLRRMIALRKGRRT